MLRCQVCETSVKKSCIQKLEPFQGKLCVAVAKLEEASLQKHFATEVTNDLMFATLGLGLVWFNLYLLCPIPPFWNAGAHSTPL